MLIVAIFTHTDAYSCQRRLVIAGESFLRFGWSPHRRRRAMPPSARSFNWMSSFGSSLGSDFCLSRLLSSFSSRSLDFLWCLCVCRVEGNFSHFSFWLHERKEKMYADFFFFFSWREKIVLVLLLLFGSSRRNWNFFSSQLTPTVITVFSHRKVACYLHKQKNKSSEFFYFGKNNPRDLTRARSRRSGKWIERTRSISDGIFLISMKEYFCERS